MCGVGLEQNFQRFLLRGCTEFLWPMCYPGEIFFKTQIFFLEQLWVHSKMERMVEKLPMYSLPPSYLHPLPCVLRCPVMSDLWPMVCNLPVSSIHGDFQERILEWIAISFSRVLHLLPLMDLTLTPDNYPKSKVYVRIHSWWCTLWVWINIWRHVSITIVSYSIFLSP